MLLDIMMPEMNGYQVLKHIKSSQDLREIRVIMISAGDELDRVVRCIEVGDDYSLPKPCNAVPSVPQPMAPNWAQSARNERSSQCNAECRISRG